MAANKVTGVRSALVWSEETATLAREHNDANVVSVGGRMHSRRRHDPVRRGLPRHAVQRATSGTSAGSASSADYEATRELPAAARVRPADRAGRCLRATPSTGSRTELTDAFGGRRVRVQSPQGRFADAAALLDGQVLVGAEAWGKHLFVEFPGERFVHVHLGLIGKFDVVRDAPEVPLAGRPGAAAAGRRRRPTARRTPTSAAPPSASC